MDYPVRLSRRSLLASMAALAGCAAIVPVTHALASTENVVRWHFSTVYPAGTAAGRGIAAFSAEIDRRNKRQMDAMEIIPDFQSPLDASSLLEAVQMKQMAAAEAFSGSLAGLDPVFELPTLPLLTKSPADARRLLSLAQPLYEAAFKRVDLHLLYAVPWPPSGLWSKTAVTSLKALWALHNIRAYDNASAAMLSFIGAWTNQLSLREAIQGVRDGSIDGVLSSGDGAAGIEFARSLPFFMPLNCAIPLSFGFVNARAYASLSPSLKQTVDAAASATGQQQWANLDAQVKANQARMRQRGVVIEDPIPSDVRSALDAAGASLAKVWQDRVDTVTAQVIERYRQGAG
jgi:TRAP-type transport system periplasmic protein